MPSIPSLEEEKFSLVNPLSWIVFFGYLFLGVLTFVLIDQFVFARQIFASTELVININAVWFSLGIAGYGAVALYRNYKRARLSNLDIKLDSQFLLVIAFFFLGLNQVIDLYLFLKVISAEPLKLALQNTGKVFEFGGFVAGLGSIYFSRRQ